MSKRLFQEEQRASLGDAVTSLTKNIAEAGASVYSPNVTRGLLSLESIDEGTLAEVRGTANNARSVLASTLADLGYDTKNFSAESYQEVEHTTAARRDRASRDAGAIIMCAAGDVSGYHAKATSRQAPAGGDGVRVIDSASMLTNSGLDYTPDDVKLSVESFDENELKKHVGFSALYAALTARQADFAEAFFPTFVISPDQVGVDVKVRRNMVLPYQNHDTSGKAAELAKRHILDAYRDHRILENESTQIIPVVRDDSKEFFVDPALVKPRTVPNEIYDVLTAPLVFGKQIDLLGISQTDAMLKAGMVDTTDSVDAHARLDNIYISFGGKAVAFNVRRMPRSGFVKSTEGDSREMSMQFFTQDLLVNGDLVEANDKAEVPALAGLKSSGIQLRYTLSVTGRLNVEYGNVSLNATDFAPIAAFNKDGEPLALTDASVTAITEALKPELVGWDLHGRRSNSNRRHRGIQVDVTEFVERYTVPLSSPISSVAPLATDKSAKDLEAIINASNIRTNNNAVTLLLRYVEEVEAATKAPFYDYTLTSLAGIGRLVVHPFFDRITLDMEKEVNSVQSAQKIPDISGVLISTIRELAYRMVRDSNYQAALDASSEGRGEKPHLVIGTDIVTQQFLMVTGDNRTMSIGMDHEVVATPDARMAGKIILSFVRQNVNEPDALSLGSHLYVPELSSVVPVTRNNNVTRETMVQMRNLHITNLPIIAIIEVNNLDKVAQRRVELDVNSKAVKADENGGTTGEGTDGGEDGKKPGEGGTNGGSGK